MTVTKRQALLSLFELRGIKNDDIEAQINLVPDEHDCYRALVDWQGPAVLMLAGGLGLTSSDLVQLFDYAQAM